MYRRTTSLPGERGWHVDKFFQENSKSATISQVNYNKGIIFRINEWRSLDKQPENSLLNNSTICESDSLRLRDLTELHEEERGTEQEEEEMARKSREDGEIGAKMKSWA